MVVLRVMTGSTSLERFPGRMHRGAIHDPTDSLHTFQPIMASWKTMLPVILACLGKYQVMNVIFHFSKKKPSSNSVSFCLIIHLHIKFSHQMTRQSY
jgi:hypothetical protein